MQQTVFNIDHTVYICSNENKKLCLWLYCIPVDSTDLRHGWIELVDETCYQGNGCH